MTRVASRPAPVVRRPGLLRRLRARTDSTTMLILLVWGYVLVPRIVQTMTAPKYRATISDPIPVSSLGQLAERGLAVALGGFCVLVVLRGTVALPTRHRLALLALLTPWIYMVSRDVYADVSPDRDALLFPLLVLAVWVLQPPVRRLALLGWLVGFTSVLSVLLGAFLPMQGILVTPTGAFVDPEKQLIPIGILIGPFTDGNNLGQFLLAGMAWVALVPRRIPRLVLLAATAAAIVWSGSRSSMLAVLIGALAALLLVVAARPSRQSLTVVVVGAVALAVTALPLFTTDVSAFTNRGQIWISSLQGWTANPVFGLASNWYVDAGELNNGLGGFAYHGHNQFVQTLATGGLIYLALTGVLLLATGLAAGRQAAHDTLVPAVFLTMLLVSCTQEVSFGVVDRAFLLCVTTLPIAVVLFADPHPRPGP
jgi:hypothetical protein